jgi:hypothetical protein
MDAVKHSRYGGRSPYRRANPSPRLAPFRQAVEVSHPAPRHFDGIGIHLRGIASVRAHSLLSLLKRLSSLRLPPCLHLKSSRRCLFGRRQIPALLDRLMTATDGIVTLSYPCVRSCRTGRSPAPAQTKDGRGHRLIWPTATLSALRKEAGDCSPWDRDGSQRAASACGCRCAHPGS